MKESMNVIAEVESVRRQFERVESVGEKLPAEFVAAIEERAREVALRQDAQDRLAALESIPFSGTIENRMRAAGQRQALREVLERWEIPVVPTEIADPVIAASRDAVLTLIAQTEVHEPRCEAEHRIWVDGGGRGPVPLRTLADRAAVEAWSHLDEQLVEWRQTLQIELPAGDPLACLVTLAGRREAGLALVERASKVRELVKAADDSHAAQVVADVAVA